MRSGPALAIACQVSVRLRPGGAGRPLLETRTCLRFVWSIIGAACALASVTDGEIMAREIRRPGRPSGPLDGCPRRARTDVLSRRADLQPLPRRSSEAPGPNGHMAGHRFPGPERRSSYAKMAGSACRIRACLRSETGGIWLVRLVLGDLLVLTRGGDLPGEIQGPGTSRAHKTISDTPGRFCDAGRSCRYQWSWPEPPAGVIPDQDRSRRARARPGPAGSWGHERLIGWRCL